MVDGAGMANRRSVGSGTRPQVGGGGVGGWAPWPAEWQIEITRGGGLDRGRGRDRLQDLALVADPKFTDLL